MTLMVTIIEEEIVDSGNENDDTKSNAFEFLDDTQQNEEGDNSSSSQIKWTPVRIQKDMNLLG